MKERQQSVKTLNYECEGVKLLSICLNLLHNGYDANENTIAIKLKYDMHKNTIRTILQFLKEDELIESFKMIGDKEIIHVTKITKKGFDKLYSASK